ncbi:MAG: hypothetical protein KC543_09955 [Myxococcales bacterium]|nr:hypothetical protein [Myxococcales bacterium]
MKHLSLLLVTTALFALGCGGKSWKVVTPASAPDALRGATSITYASSFDGVMIDGKSLDETLAAEKTPEDRADLKASLDRMDESAFAALQKDAKVPVTRGDATNAAGEAHLTIQYKDIVRGSHGPMGRATRVTAWLVWTRGGQPAGTIELKPSVGPSMYRPSRAQRMSVAADYLGKIAAKYFASQQK